MRKAKAVYEYLPIFGRHIFYGNDLTAMYKLLHLYYKDNQIDFEDLGKTVIDYSYTQGLSWQIHSLSNPHKVEAFCMYVRDDVDINVVAHEASHIANFLLIFMGFPVDGIDDEPAAYLTGHLTEQYLIHFRGYKQKKGELKKIKK